MTFNQNRRDFLKTSTLSTAGWSLSASLVTPKSQAAVEKKDAGNVQPYRRYSDLLAAIRKRGHKYRILGYAPDRSPIVAVKAGGEKLPAIFISAGSHSTEHAGVATAVELIDQLETKHQVYIVPCRDPIGLNGYQYALSQSLDEEPQLDTLEEAEDLLRKKGEVLYDEEGRLLSLIGEIGFANRGLYRKIKKGDPILEPLRGRRIYFPSRYEDVEGSGLFHRAYTLVVTPEGEILHINRFHNTRWAPAEVRCVRNLMAEIKPKLTFDCHEHGGDHFWFSARHQNSDEDELWELRMAKEAIAAVRATGVRLAPDEYRPGSFFSKLEPGVFMLDANKRGEGLNLIDFAAHKYGPGFTVETGMRKSTFQQRVNASMLTVQTAVKVFEERYA